MPNSSRGFFMSLADGGIVYMKSLEKMVLDLEVQSQQTTRSVCSLFAKLAVVSNWCIAIFDLCYFLPVSGKYVFRHCILQAGIRYSESDLPTLIKWGSQPAIQQSRGEIDRERSSWTGNRFFGYQNAKWSNRLIFWWVLVLLSGWNTCCNLKRNPEYEQQWIQEPEI